MSYEIMVKQGNLLSEENATFVVNASNTTLILGSGVSLAFKRHCGTVLQTEMTNTLQSIDQPLQKGDVIATSSGNAKNFMYALHAAIMDYNDGVKKDQKTPTIETIGTALENIERYLQWYNEERKLPMKLVIPLLGCGVGGLDKKEVITTYKTFFNRYVDYECEVVVYGYDNDDFTLIKSILTQDD